jgi:hypothetical protein
MTDNPFYVGQTSNPAGRKGAHESYWEEHTFHILDQTNDSKIASQLENSWYWKFIKDGYEMHQREPSLNPVKRGYERITYKNMTQPKQIPISDLAFKMLNDWCLFYGLKFGRNISYTEMIENLEVKQDWQKKATTME